MAGGGPEYGCVGTVTILGPRCQRIDFECQDRYIIRMTKRPLRAVLLILATAIAGAGGYTAYWYSAAAELQAAIADWSAQRRAAGWTVEIGQPNIVGFPSWLEVFVQTPRLAGPDGRWRWAAPNIRAAARPWSPGAVSVFAPGIHVYSSNKGDIWGEFEKAEADISAEDSGLSGLIVRFGGINLRPPSGVAVLADHATLRLTKDAAIDPEGPTPETGTGVAIDIRSVTLPARWRPALGRKLARLSLDAVITGQIVLGPSLTTTLATWRDSGGVAEIRAFAVDWNALILRADGTFALDRALQPEGAMTADIRGIDRTADQLIAAGVIDARAAFAARVANRALSFRGGSAKLPLSIQDRKLYMGPVPLLRLNAVQWD